MRLQNRHILLFLDNAPSHPKHIELTNIKLVFFPANTTSHLQPMDQGIIQNLKTQYRKRVLRHTLHVLDTPGATLETVVKEITVLDACYWISSSMKDIASDTVTKCFARCGFGSCTGSADSMLEQLDREVTSLLNSLPHAEGLLPLHEYLEIDAQAPASEQLEEGWENHLVEELRQPTSHDVTFATSNPDGELRQ